MQSSNIPTLIGPPVQINPPRRPKLNLDELHQLISVGDHLPMWVTHDVANHLLTNYPHPNVVQHPGTEIKPVVVPPENIKKLAQPNGALPPTIGDPSLLGARIPQPPSFKFPGPPPPMAPGI